MASFASLVGFGSTCTCTCTGTGQLEGTRLSIRRIYFSSSCCGFNNLLVGKKGRYVSVCKYSVATDFVADQETSVSLNESSNENAAADLLLKPARRPVLILSRVEDSSTATGKDKTLKSVWRKGNPIATVEKVVKEATKSDNVTDERSKLEVTGNVEGQLVAPLRPQRVQPQLQSKPFATPVKRPPILKDSGAAPKSAATDESDSGTKTKERIGPILIDKFASKRPAADPLMAQAVLAPPKPGKIPAPGKFKDDFRKKAVHRPVGPKLKMMRHQSLMSQSQVQKKEENGVRLVGRRLDCG
ncbi:hypothetical protein QVD17_19342 [Tagetes erecta]|uniref:Uncharacterized protein n=1 Tax=Tagetes erecta TaxID=13708 RepID=A0AAD8KMV5_TARER|nr:hypothetical protein QVD17_19342 [Tagetes erecta]